MGSWFSTDATQDLNDKQDKIDELKEEIMRLKKTQAKATEYISLFDAMYARDRSHHAKSKAECDYLGGTFAMKRADHNDEMFPKCDVPRLTQAQWLKFLRMRCERFGNPDGSSCDIVTKHIPACGGGPNYLPKGASSDEPTEGSLLGCAFKRMEASRASAPLGV